MKDTCGRDTARNTVMDIAAKGREHSSRQGIGLEGIAPGKAPVAAGKLGWLTVARRQWVAVEVAEVPWTLHNGFDSLVVCRPSAPC